MKQLNTRAIVLTRVNYGEADRILTLLTPDYGKVSVIAKSVRKSKSKLAGGIELFSISEVSYVIGKSKIFTLTSTRLEKHFGDIVRDVARTEYAYSVLKLFNKSTEDNPESAYFNLLTHSLEAINDSSINLELVQSWVDAQLLKLSGHAPDLHKDRQGRALDEKTAYLFDYDAMKFEPSLAGTGNYGGDIIKFLRLIFSNYTPKSLQKVKGAESFSVTCRPLVRDMLSTYVRL